MIKKVYLIKDRKYKTITLLLITTVLELIVIASLLIVINVKMMCMRIDMNFNANNYKVNWSVSAIDCSL